MNPDRRFAVFSAVLTVAAAAVFYAIATGGHVYAPGARALQQKLASTNDWSTFMSTFWFGDLVYFVVRKTYGASAFAILGFLAAPAFARNRRVAYTAAALGFVRLGLEVAERIANGRDTNLESAFDIAAGTCAAALGAVVWNALSKRRETEA